MEQIEVGILLEDRTYAAALARGLSRESRNLNFRVEDRYSGECGLYLSDRSSGEDETVPWIVLSRSPDDEEIFMFEDCRVLVDRLIYIYFEKTGRLAEYRGSSTCRLVIFVETAGGSGVTATALAAARMLNTIYGASCLYLNLCPVDDSRKYVEEEPGAGIRKLMFHLLKEKEFPLRSFVQEAEGIDVFRTAAINRSAAEMTGELFDRLLAAVERQGTYDYFFVDAGNFWSREAMEMLGRGDCVVLVSGDEGGKPLKYAEKLAAEVERRAGADSVLRVLNFFDDEKMAAEETERLCLVSRDEDAFVRMGGRMRIDLSGNYGLDIALAARKIRGICNG